MTAAPAGFAVINKAVRVEHGSELAVLLLKHAVALYAYGAVGEVCFEHYWGGDGICGCRKENSAKAARKFRKYAHRVLNLYYAPEVVV